MCFSADSLTAARALKAGPTAPIRHPGLAALSPACLLGARVGIVGCHIAARALRRRRGWSGASVRDLSTDVCDLHMGPTLKSLQARNDAVHAVGASTFSCCPNPSSMIALVINLPEQLGHIH